MESVEKAFGKMFVCADKDICSPCIRPVYEPETIKFIRDHVKPGTVFFDIGAHVGLFSIYAQQKGAIVHAFEAHPKNYKVLEANAKMYNGITPHCIAVWNQTKKLHLTSKIHCAQAFVQGEGDTTPFYEVEGYALDDMNELPLPSFVKFDIQGAEFMGLKGMGQRLLPTVRFLQVELYPLGFKYYKCTCKDVVGFLKDCGFKCISHSEKELLTFKREFINAQFVR